MAEGTKKPPATKGKQKKSAHLAKQGAGGGFAIVNPSGTVHIVTKEVGNKLLRKVGYRIATDDEIAAYNEDANQHSRKRIAEPHVADLEELTNPLDDE